MNIIASEIPVPPILSNQNYDYVIIMRLHCCIIAVKFCRLGELCLSFGLVQPFLSCKHYSSMCEKFGHRFPKDLKATAATMAGYQDLSKFERSITVGTRKIGHSISEVAMKFEFSHSTISRVYRECRESGKTSNLRHRCGRKKIMQERD
ncbi:HTH_Tnp_Tc3_2 domain-containing protein [Trichonephila clavipes]|nr:HTH_Tnp_Tc3_2 domain-containing protein [Trichonephila clavipes]